MKNSFIEIEIDISTTRRFSLLIHLTKQLRRVVRCVSFDTSEKQQIMHLSDVSNCWSQFIRCIISDTSVN